MSEREEKLAIAAARSTKGAARCRLIQLEHRWGRLHRKPVLKVGDRVCFEPMGELELWRVSSIGEDGPNLEQEDLMAYLQLLQGGGSPEHPCTFCGEVWTGPDDTKHGAHQRGATCGHMGIFNCQLKMIEGFCSCAPSGPAYPRQPHEPRYEMDTAGNMRKVMVELPPPPLTNPAPAPSEVHTEPVDHREEVGGFQRGDPCAFQHRFQADGVCAVCRTRMPDGCTCAPTGVAKTGYVHAPSCKLLAKTTEPPIPETPPWVHLTEDGSEMKCQRCGALVGMPLDLDAVATVVELFEETHRACPEKHG